MRYTIDVRPETNNFFWFLTMGAAVLVFALKVC
jgi:hypothetical protein